MEPKNATNNKIDPANGLRIWFVETIGGELSAPARNLKIRLTILNWGVYGPRKQNWSAVEALLHSVATEDAVRIDRGQRHDVSYTFRCRSRDRNELRSGADGVFNIQGPRLISLNDILDEAKSLTGRYPEIIETEPAAQVSVP